MNDDTTLTAVHAARRENLRLLAAKYDGQKNLAARLGYGRSYLSQILSAKPKRYISERTARAIETKLTLPAGWMDIARGL